MDGETFDSYYWYLSELQDIARELGLSSSGGKFAIHDRISHYLRTGEILAEKAKKTDSKFDWTNETLYPTTVITDNYRNNPNVRRFFVKHLGPGFRFSITFMKWMKAHIGYTLGDAIDAWPQITQLRKDQPIEDHNQYNQYTRDFLRNNPHLTKADVDRAWKAKIEMPRPGSKGRGIRYSDEDLKWI